MNHHFFLKSAVLASLLLIHLPSYARTQMGGGALTISPFASVSSTKALKAPKKGEDTQEEVVTQRNTYGLAADVRLGRWFSLGIKGGVNAVDQTKKAVAMRDEYGDIDFQSDANVDPNNQNATYRYQEEQRLGTAKLLFRPALGRYVWLKAGAGVRARQRLLTITETDKDAIKITDPVRYHAVGTAGVGFRLLGAFRGSMDYNFYFLKFPKTQPHEQEAVVSFGVQI